MHRCCCPRDTRCVRSYSPPAVRRAHSTAAAHRHHVHCLFREVTCGLVSVFGRHVTHRPEQLRLNGPVLLDRREPRTCTALASSLRCQWSAACGAYLWLPAWAPTSAERAS